MARIRTIKPEFWESQTLGSNSVTARLSFAGLISLADDEGRGRGDLRFLLGRLHPYAPDVSEQGFLDAVTELVIAGLVTFYKHKDSVYYQLPGFLEHQFINRPTPSKIPKPTDDSVRAHGALIEASTQEGKGKERKGKESYAGNERSLKRINGSTEVNGSKPRTPTTIQKLVEAYKVAKDIPKDDKGWDRANFGRYSKAAQSLLEAFNGDVEKAAMYMIVQGQDWDASSVSWTLETITRHAWDNRAKISPPAEEKSDGLKHGALDDGRMPDQRSTRRITRSGDLAGEALQGIRDIPRVGGQDFPDELSEA